MDWQQIGEDFRQKYEGTFCRYISPLTKQKEIFQVSQVRPKGNTGPDITLFNRRAGELFLNYTTDAELDFSYPECGYFQHEDKALRFYRRYERQWRKGLCPNTASIEFPYNSIYPVQSVGFKEEVLLSSYSPQKVKSLDEAMRILGKGDCISVVLTKNLALGLAIDEGKYLLWFESEPIAEILGNKVTLHVPQFKQELTDYLREIGDYARIIV